MKIMRLFSSDHAVMNKIACEFQYFIYTMTE